MFIPRNGLRAKPHLYNNGSIKDNFVNFDEEIEELESKMVYPGPGAYKSIEQRSQSQKGRYMDYKFGSVAERFKNNSSGTDLGPGQYR